MGRRLFTGESVSDILAAVLRSEPDWSELPADTPPRIRKLLRRCLERDRKQRLQAIGEARIAIDTPEVQTAAPAVTPVRRRPAILWLMAAAVAGALIAVAWYRLESRRRSRRRFRAGRRFCPALPCRMWRYRGIGTHLVYGGPTRGSRVARDPHHGPAGRQNPWPERPGPSDRCSLLTVSGLLFSREKSSRRLP